MKRSLLFTILGLSSALAFSQGPSRNLRKFKELTETVFHSKHDRQWLHNYGMVRSGVVANPNEPENKFSLFWNPFNNDAGYVPQGLYFENDSVRTVVYSTPLMAGKGLKTQRRHFVLFDTNRDHLVDSMLVATTKTLNARPEQSDFVSTEPITEPIQQLYSWILKNHAAKYLRNNFVKEYIDVEKLPGKYFELSEKDKKYHLGICPEEVPNDFRLVKPVLLD